MKKLTPSGVLQFNDASVQMEWVLICDAYTNCVLVKDE